MSIVFESAGIGGNLFQGKAFWIAQRVPQRLRWVDAVKANGGSVTALDKNADILIADHARADAPPGSYSWTFIQDSVKNGRLENLEDHPAGHPKGTVRPVGSKLPTKTSRTPFTDADDRMLADWVTKAERQGLMTKGNEIYKDLERANPRHTYQSWRDRWVKYVSYKPRPELSPDAAYEGSTPGPVTRGGSGSNHNRARASRPSFGTVGTSSLHSTAEVSSSPHDKSEPTPGKPFTEDDTQLLEDIYDDIIDIDESKVIAAWNAWAKEHPQHTAEEWLGHWINKVKPGRGSKSANAQSIATGLEQLDNSSTPQPTSQLLKSPKVGASQSIVHDFPPNTAKDGGLPTQNEDSQSAFTTEDVFTKTLNIFADAQSMKIDFRPIVCGRKVPLFALWSVVNKDENGGFDQVEVERRWQQIAVQLNFNTFRFPAAAEQIRDIYEQQLVDFEEFCKTIEPPAEAEDELTDSQMIDMQLRRPPYQDSPKKGPEELERAEDYNDDLETSSSLQQAQDTARKRPHPTLRTHSTYNSNPNSDFNMNKRLRSNQGEVLEIPSTPEEEPLHHLQNVLDPETQDFHFDGSLIQSSSIASSGEDTPRLQSTIAGPAHPREQLQEDSSTQSQTDSLRDEAEMQAFIDRYITLGYSEQVVLEALQATTMDTGDVAEVMEALMRGDGIPSNIQGVWTSEDDRLLSSPLRDDYHSMEIKHGKERCETRRKFLRDAEEALKELNGRSRDS